MFFKHIEIHNFRGIESLKINNIKQVNLITGKNNCGKTSVLEAVLNHNKIRQIIHNLFNAPDLLGTEHAGTCQLGT